MYRYRYILYNLRALLSSNWSWNRAKETAPAPAKYTSSGRLRLRNPDVTATTALYIMYIILQKLHKKTKKHDLAPKTDFINTSSYEPRSTPFKRFWPLWPAAVRSSWRDHPCCLWMVRVWGGRCRCSPPSHSGPGPCCSPLPQLPLRLKKKIKFLVSCCLLNILHTTLTEHFFNIFLIYLI